MKSIRNLAYAALMAVSLLNLTPTLARAQESERGKFKLSHAVRWGSAQVPAGEYEFAFDAYSPSRVLRLSSLTGTPVGFMLLVTDTGSSEPTDSSRLILETSSEGTYVSALQLHTSGVTLYFALPPRSNARQVAKAAAPALSSGQ